jgi:hypothetical protein
MVRAVVCVVLLGFVQGCGPFGSESASPPVPAPQAASLSREDQALLQKLEGELSTIVNARSQRYAPLRYEYNEGLLASLDQIEQALSGKVSGEPPRHLPNLDVEEEQEHFRESIRRWEKESGKNLREQIDDFKAEVAQRKPGEAFHPDFQRRFSQVFDSFVKIEIEEMRGRRNQAIHASVAELLNPYRAEHPEVVRGIEDLLNSDAQFKRPSDQPSGPAESDPGRTPQS